MAKTVIIVDDEQDIKETFSEILTLNGIQVVATASDGKEGVEKYRIFKPDIILVDIMMPNYDGFYALEHLKKEFPNSNIVVITGDINSETQIRLKNMKDIKILLKPISFDTLLSLFKD